MSALSSSSQAVAPIIAARGLAKVYRLGEAEVAALAGVDLDVAAGSFVVLKGDSGSGKSTLLSLLAGLDRPTAGSLSVSGRDMASLAGGRRIEFRRRTVGVIFQSFNLLPSLSVLENVALPGMLAGRPREELVERARALLARLNLEKRLDHEPARLSGGEMQRTAIARALINEPAVILADEPTGNLDTGNGRIVIELLAELGREDARTVVTATHSDMADDYADAVVRLRDGRLVDGESESA